MDPSGPGAPTPSRACSGIAAPLGARLSIARAWRRLGLHARRVRPGWRGQRRALLPPWGLARVGGGGRGAPRGDVEELEDGAGPLGGADGGHRGRRACETATGPAGRCHVTVSSAAHAAAASVSLVSPSGSSLLLVFSLLLSLAAQPGTLRCLRLRPGSRRQSSERCSPGGRV